MLKAFRHFYFGVNKSFNPLYLILNQYIIHAVHLEQFPRDNAFEWDTLCGL